MEFKMSQPEKKIFTGNARTSKGTGDARALRRAGKVPAVVYNKGGKNQHVALDAHDVYTSYSKGRFFSKIFTLDIDGKKFDVLPQDIQLHAVNDAPFHVDFIAVEAHSQVKVKIPVEFTNKLKSPGLKRGGVLNVVRRLVEILCNADSIPEKLIADLGDLKIGDNVKWSDLQKPEAIEPTIRGRDFTIATIVGRMAEDETPQAAAAADASAVPASTAKAPAAGAAGAKAPAAAAAPAKKK
jgi:large subunit ribosomal protein L25